jgi:hypothetical protein
MQDLETKQPGVQVAYHEVHGEFKKWEKEFSLLRRQDNRSLSEQT